MGQTVEMVIKPIPLLFGGIRIRNQSPQITGGAGIYIGEINGFDVELARDPSGRNIKIVRNRCDGVIERTVRICKGKTFLGGVLGSDGGFCPPNSKLTLERGG